MKEGYSEESAINIVKVIFESINDNNDQFIDFTGFLPLYITIIKI